MSSLNIDKEITFVRLSEAIESLEDSSNAKSIVVIPPDGGGNAMDSDVKGIDDIMASDEEMFEPAGQLQIDVDDEDNGDTPADTLAGHN